MPMTKNAESALKSLARRGDSFAKVILNQGQQKDNQLVASLAKRGDLVAQCQESGDGASIRARAIVGNLSVMGDIVAAGIMAGTLSVSLAASPASPFVYGSGSVVFTATATAPEGKTLQYRFLVDGTERQAWGTGNTYTVSPTGNDAALFPGRHTVVVEISSDETPVTAEGRTFLSFVSTVPGASAVSLSAINPATQDTFASPQPVGTVIPFAATATIPHGAGSSSFEGDSGWAWFQFSVDGVVVQPWSRSSKYDLPASTPAGSYDVKVDVTTADVPTVSQANDTVTFVLE